MFLRFQLVLFNLASSILLIFFLCLGSQNLNKRYALNVPGVEMVKLPIGFLVGISFTLGSLSGGITSSILMTKKNKY